jgi:hypothetical protein
VVCCTSDPVVDNFGAAWGPSGQLLIGTARRIRVSDAGTGAARMLLPAPVGVAYSHPYLLPDGHRFVFTAATSFTDPSRSDQGIYIGTLDGTVSQRISPERSGAIYWSGQLVFVKTGVLVSQQFDDEAAVLVGDARPIASHFLVANTRFSAFSGSRTGILAFSPGEQDLVQFSWTNRRGTSREAIGEAGPYLFTQLSPDGERVAFDRYDPQYGSRDVWVMRT